MARSCYIVILINFKKGPGTTFPPPALSQRHLQSKCYAAHNLTKFHFDSI